MLKLLKKIAGNLNFGIRDVTIRDKSLKSRFISPYLLFNLFIFFTYLKLKTIF